MLWIILTIIFALILWGIIAILVEKIKQSIKQSIRNQAARDVLKDFDIQKEKIEIQAITRDSFDQKYRCPACSGILISRTGKFGQFWGCSNYPTCKFTKNTI